MAPARLIAALIAVAALAGCGGSSGSSTASTSQGATTQTQQAASNSCPDRLTTTETCWFAGLAAKEHATHLTGFVLAGEPMKCIGTKQEWICESTRRKAWVRRS